MRPEGGAGAICAGSTRASSRRCRAEVNDLAARGLEARRGLAADGASQGGQARRGHPLSGVDDERPGGLNRAAARERVRKLETNEPAFLDAEGKPRLRYGKR